MTRRLSLLLGSWLACTAVCGAPALCQDPQDQHDRQDKQDKQVKQDKQPLRLLFLTAPDSARDGEGPVLGSVSDDPGFARNGHWVKAMGVGIGGGFGVPGEVLGHEADI